MTVYVSTAAVAQPRGLWEILDAFKASGVEAVELGFCDLDDATALVPRLRAYGFRYVVHNYFPPPAEPFVLNLASADRELAERSLDLVLAALDLTAELGASFYGVHCGWITDPVGFDGFSFILPDPAPGEATAARERFVDALGKAVARAAANDVDLLVENSVCTEDLRGKLLLLECDEMTALFREVASPRLGLLLDTGHLNVTSSTLGFDRDDYVAAVAEHVRALHLHDNDGLVDSHLPAEPGGWVGELLHRPRFAGLPATVEARFPDAAAARAYADRVAAHAAAAPQDDSSSHEKTSSSRASRDRGL